MKSLISTFVIFIFATLIDAQTSSTNLPIDNEYWFESREWKSDSILNNLFQSIATSFYNDLKIATQGQDISDNIRKQWNAEINVLAASLGVDPNDAFNSHAKPKDTVALDKFIELRSPIDSKYAAMLRDAETAASKDINLQIENAFIAAAKKYYQSSQRIQSKP
jgi:hypothetical protein